MLGKFLQLLLCCYAVMFGACQHQRSAETSDALKVSQSDDCEEPQFEMKYKLGEVMPSFIDLGVEMQREKGAFRASLGDNNNYNTEIRIDAREEGLIASISVREGRGMQKKSEGLIVNRYGAEEPFMLVIENGVTSGDPREISVKAREMSERRNRGIVDDTNIRAMMSSENPKYLQVSSHHRGLIVTEGGRVRERFFMKNGIHRGKTISSIKFQDIAEEYLFCLGKEQGKGAAMQQEEGKGSEQQQDGK